MLIVQETFYGSFNKAAGRGSIPDFMQISEKPSTATVAFSHCCNFE